MTDKQQQNSIAVPSAELHRPEWDEPIICRVEVDLPAWLAQLTGGRDWEVYSEEEEENCVSFALRQGSKLSPKLAEVTLYHNGYAIVVFMFGMMRLSSKTPSKNQEKEEDNV